MRDEPTADEITALLAEIGVPNPAAGEWRKLSEMPEIREAATAPAFAVISPDGEITWQPLRAEREVEAIVAGKYAGALDRASVSGPLRLYASDVALLFPEDYLPNPAAERIITALSGGRIVQPWRGHVALVEYDRDPETRELLWPTAMSGQWQQRIREAAG